MMNRQKLSAFAAGVSAAIFGLLYPEYVLLPDTYEYIRMETSVLEETFIVETSDYGRLEELLMSEPEQIEISSYFLEKLKNKGLVLWKNMDWKNADTP